MLCNESYVTLKSTRVQIMSVYIDFCGRRQYSIKHTFFLFNPLLFSVQNSEQVRYECYIQEDKINIFSKFPVQPEQCIKSIQTNFVHDYCF